jgi:hypothetical protein
MSLSVALLVGLLVVLFMIFVAVAAVRSARSMSRRPPSMPRADPASGPRAREGERLASASSEAIEDLVNQALAKAGVDGVQVDFGTAHDGSLEIWIGDDRYTSVDSIPDARVRQAVADAVASFNR